MSYLDEVNNKKSLVKEDYEKQRFVSSINSLSKEIKTLLDNLEKTGAKKLDKDFINAVKQLTNVTKSIEKVKVTSDDEIKNGLAYFANVIASLDTKPVVNVPQPKVEVNEREIDLTPLLNAIKDLKKSKPTEVKVDVGKFAESITSVEAAIKNLKFPVPNYVLPFKDQEGKATQVILDEDGNLPISQDSGSVTSSNGQNSDTDISGGNWSSDTYTGQWEEQADYEFVVTSLLVDESGTLYYDFSQDGTTVISTYPVNGFGITSGTHSYHTAHKGGFRYFRLRFVGDGGRSYFYLKTQYTNVNPMLRAPISQQVSSEDDAITVKALNVGETPNESYRASKISGPDDDNTTTTPLPANTGGSDHIWRGTWREWATEGFVALEASVTSDVVGALFVDFSTEESPTNGDDTSISHSITYIFDPAVDDLLRRITPVQSRWVRLRYVNASTEQTTFSITNSFLVNAPPLVMQQLSIPPTSSSLAGIVQATNVGQTASGFDFVGLNGFGNSMNVRNTDTVTTAIETNTAHNRIESPDRRLSGRINAVNSLTQIPKPSTSVMQEIAGIRIKNLSSPTDNTPVDLVPSGAAYGTGFRLFGREAVDETITEGSGDYDASSIYLITDSTTAVESPDNIAFDTLDSNSGVTNPTNVYTDDANFATLDSDSDTMTISGPASADVTGTTLVSAKIKAKMKKESGVAGQAVGFVDEVNAVDTNGGTSIVSPTVTANEDYFYLVTVARHNTAADVTTITNTMGFSSFTLIGSINTGNDESYTSMYRAVGTPLNNGTITVNFDDDHEYGIIKVARFSNVDLSDPIVDTETDSPSSTSDLTYSDTLTTVANGMVYYAIGHEIITHNNASVTAGYTVIGTAGSAANDDQLLTTVYDDIAGTSSTATGTFTAGGGDADWGAVFASLRPQASTAPVVTISTNKGSEELVAELTSESSTDYEKDITADIPI